MEVDFNKAIEIAKENAKELLPEASNFNLEGIIINKDDDYEVTLSYIVDYSEKLKDRANEGSVGLIMAALARKKEEKIFIVHKYGKFLGFRNIK
ncbi:hypothetical protein [Acinetobacter pittii]|uniref:hypothetical protein n=1 Tax=Acinetobacter pittii TaxID=48296 RepID=UPI00300860A1